MIQIKDPRLCCGCTACASACTHNAITMEPDALGFFISNCGYRKMRKMRLV